MIDYITPNEDEARYYTGKDDQHRNTFIGVIFSVVQYLVIIAAVVIILRLHGVNVISIFTGLGIVATIIGLALQDARLDETVLEREHFLRPSAD